jgi:hypothetical protein
MSGIVVVNATYGAGSTTTDVTKTVSSMIKDGVLSVPAVSPAVLNVTDPLPGQPKVLRISYTINGGAGLMTAVNDGQSFYIDAPPQRTASGLEITKAEYGVDGNMNDVTDAVISHVKNGSIDIVVGFKKLGVPDPNPNKVKQFEIEYKINGATNKTTLKDGDRFKESAPAVDGSITGTPAQAVTSAMGMVWTNIMRFFSFFLYSLSFFTCLRFGNSQGRMPLFWGALGLIPMFGFIGLPIYVLIAHLFTGSDIVV